LDTSRPQKKVWHGSGSGGVRAKTAYCEAWHSDNPSNVGLGSDLLRGQILGQENIGCNNKLVVLCVEIASHNNYHRRRRSLPQPADSATLEFSTYDNTLKNLTFDQYSHVLDSYDQNSSNIESNKYDPVNSKDPAFQPELHEEEIEI